MARVRGLVGPERAWLTILIISTGAVACAGSSATSESIETTAVRRLSRVEVSQPGPDEQLLHEPELDAAAPRILIRHPAEGAPYRLTHQPAALLSDFWDCRGTRRHRGVDLSGNGPLAGLGTPVVAIGRSRVVSVGTPFDDPAVYGRPLMRAGTVRRGGEELPTSARIEPYGLVHFFTEDRGRWRTGVLVVTELLDGPLVGHTVRYMHLGAAHPDLRAGDVVEAGQEVGLLGGTAILQSTPHVHLDIEDVQGRRVDPAPYLGLPTQARGSGCR